MGHTTTLAVSWLKLCMKAADVTSNCELHPACAHAYEKRKWLPCVLAPQRALAKGKRPSANQGLL
eukprot:2765302-Amphidinium_carterae.2